VTPVICLVGSDIYVVNSCGGPGHASIFYDYSKHGLKNLCQQAFGLYPLNHRENYWSTVYYWAKFVEIKGNGLVISQEFHSHILLAHSFYQRP
jgi:hypothetical protein